jgi:hypothetical protein
VLLLGHPKLRQTATELVQLYRSKDLVEKGFQSIKSLIKLRPLFHYTDPKVQAHVTICMLALLLERTLEHRLRTAGLPMTAPTCISLLSGCNLNQRRTSDGSSIYDITEANPDQLQILDSLGLQSLTDDDSLRGSLTPRAIPTPGATGHRRSSKPRHRRGDPTAGHGGMKR